MLYVFYYNKNKTPINAVEDAFSQTCVVSIFFFLTCTHLSCSTPCYLSVYMYISFLKISALGVPLCSILVSPRTMTHP